MTEELVYTSAPRGLKPGSSGFCAVVSTQGMSAPLAQALESLSGYRHLYPPGDPQAALNPVVYSHLLLNAGGKTYNVLSRISDYGLDYSHRTNKLAHHLVVGAAERPQAGPAWLLSQPGVLDSTWDGEVRIQPTGRSIPFADLSPAPCKTWEQVTGDAGWAGVLAQSWLENPDRLAFLRFDPGLPLLELICEALALIPPELRWEVTFSTYATTLPQNVTCQWRCLLNGSKEANDARRFVRDLQWNLSQPMGPAPDTPAAEAARCGHFLVQAERDSSDDLYDNMEAGGTGHESNAGLESAAATIATASQTKPDSIYRFKSNSSHPDAPPLPPLPSPPVRHRSKRALAVGLLLTSLAVVATFAVTIAQWPQVSTAPQQVEDQTTPQQLDPQVTPPEMSQSQPELQSTNQRPSTDGSSHPVAEESRTTPDTGLASANTPASTKVETPLGAVQAPAMDAPPEANDKPATENVDNAQSDSPRLFRLGKLRNGDFDLPSNRPILNESAALHFRYPVLNDPGKSKDDGVIPATPTPGTLALTAKDVEQTKVKYELSREKIVVSGLAENHSLDFREYGALTIADSSDLFLFIDKNPQSQERKLKVGQSFELKSRVPQSIRIQLLSCVFSEGDSDSPIDFGVVDQGGTLSIDSPVPGLERITASLSHDRAVRKFKVVVESTPNRRDIKQAAGAKRVAYDNKARGEIGGLDREGYSALRIHLFSVGPSNSGGPPVAYYEQLMREAYDNRAKIDPAEFFSKASDSLMIPLQSKDILDKTRSRLERLCESLFPIYESVRAAEEALSYINDSDEWRVASMVVGYGIEIPMTLAESKVRYVDLERIEAPGK